MNYPGWIDNLTEELGASRLRGAVSRQDAITRLRDAIDAAGDRELTLAILADFAARRIDAWHREHQNPPASPGVAYLQAELFPDLKPRLYVRPGITKPVMTMTGHDWDNAREMIRNRTEGAIDFAKADWAKFEAAYGRVRPLLDGDATTADVAAELRGEFPLEGLTA